MARTSPGHDQLAFIAVQKIELPVTHSRIAMPFMLTSWHRAPEPGISGLSQSWVHARIPIGSVCQPTL